MADVAVVPPSPVTDRRDVARPVAKVLFDLFWERDEDLHRILRVYHPLRLDQEAFFRPRGPDCQYYAALCYTVALEAIDGKIPGLLDLVKTHEQPV